MTKRTEADTEFDRRKGEAQVGIAELMEEYGYEAVIAACQEEVNRYASKSLKEDFKQEFDE